MSAEVYLKLKINGTDLEGEVQRTEGGVEKSIRILDYTQVVQTAREAGSGRATGRRQYQPIQITKAVDKTSPLLFEALVKNKKVDAEFKFLRSNNDEKGEGLAHYYTVKLDGGRISGMTQATSRDPQTVTGVITLSFQDTIQMVFDKITVTFVDGGVEAVDDWASNQ